MGQQDEQKAFKVAITPDEVDTLACDWVTLKVLAGPEVSGAEHMSAVSLFFAPGQGHARHNHPDSEQLIYMIAGRAEMTIEFEPGRPQTKVIEAGDLVTIPRGAYHSTFNIGWEPVRILAVYSPHGPEDAMRGSPEFTVLPAIQPRT